MNPRTVLILSSLTTFACGGAPFTMEPADDAGHDALTWAELDAASDGMAADNRISTAESGAPEADSPEAGPHPDHFGGPLPDGGSSDAPSSFSDAPDAPAFGSDGCALVTHDNGIGQTWVDCTPLGTYDEPQALAACVAGYGGVRSCMPHVCTSGAVTFDVVCGNIVCWAYDGARAGLASTPSTGGCPYAGDAVVGWR